MRAPALGGLLLVGGLVGALVVLPSLRWYTNPEYPAWLEAIDLASRLEEQGRHEHARQGLYRYLVALARRHASREVDADTKTYFGAKCRTAIAAIAATHLGEAEDPAATEALVRRERAENEKIITEVFDRARIGELRNQLQQRTDCWVRRDYLDEELARSPTPAVREFLLVRRSSCVEEIGRWERTAGPVEDALVEGRFDDAVRFLRQVGDEGAPPSLLARLGRAVAAVRGAATQLEIERDPWPREELARGLLDSAQGSVLGRYLRREIREARAAKAVWKARVALAGELLAGGVLARARVEVRRLVDGGLPATLSQRLLNALDEVARHDRQLARLGDPWEAQEYVKGELKERALDPTVRRFLEGRLSRSTKAIRAWDARETRLDAAIAAGDTIRVRRLWNDARRVGVPARRADVLARRVAEFESLARMLQGLRDPWRRRERIVEERRRLRGSRPLRRWLDAELGRADGEIADWNAKAAPFRAHCRGGRVVAAGASLQALERIQAPPSLLERLRATLSRLADLVGRLERQKDPWARQRMIRSALREPDAPREFLRLRLAECDDEIARWLQAEREVEALIRDGKITEAAARIARLRAQQAPGRLVERLLGKMPGIPEVPGLEWAWVGAGTYWIGSCGHRGKLGEHEFGPRRVRLARGFAISKTEITLAVYKEVDAAAFARKYDTAEAASDEPAHSLTLKECVEFCKALGGRYPKFEFSLPTETEWEIAARGGPRSRQEVLPFAVTDPAHGKGLGSAHGSAVQILKKYAVFEGNRPPRGLLKCKQKLANPIGLWDVHGSVYEWCLPDRAVFTGYDGKHFLDHPIRGGSYVSLYEACRAGARSWQKRKKGKESIGMRVLSRKR